MKKITLLIFFFIIFSLVYSNLFANSIGKELFILVKTNPFFEFGNIDIIEINEKSYIVSVGLSENTEKRKKMCIKKSRMIAEKELNKYINNVLISTYEQFNSTFFVQENSEGYSKKINEKYFQQIKEKCKGSIYGIFTVGEWLSADDNYYYSSVAVELGIERK